MLHRHATGRWLDVFLRASAQPKADGCARLYWLQATPGIPPVEFWVLPFTDKAYSHDVHAPSPFRKALARRILACIRAPEGGQLIQLPSWRTILLHPLFVHIRLAWIIKHSGNRIGSKHSLGFPHARAESFYRWDPARDPTE